MLEQWLIKDFYSIEEFMNNKTEVKGMQKIKM